MDGFSRAFHIACSGIVSIIPRGYFSLIFFMCFLFKNLWWFQQESCHLFWWSKRIGGKQLSPLFWSPSWPKLMEIYFETGIEMSVLKFCFFFFHLSFKTINTVLFQHIAHSEWLQFSWTLLSCYPVSIEQSIFRDD